MYARHTQYMHLTKHSPCTWQNRGICPHMDTVGHKGRGRRRSDSDTGLKVKCITPLDPPAKIDLSFPDPRQNKRKTRFLEETLKKSELNLCELDYL